jgi:hypothetical protein
MWVEFSSLPGLAGPAFLLFFFLEVMGIKLRDSHLLGKNAITWTVVGNSEGNKVAETTLQKAGIFIMLADSGEIISQSPEPRSVSGDELYTPQVGNVTEGFLQ